MKGCYMTQSSQSNFGFKKQLWVDNQRSAFNFPMTAVRPDGLSGEASQSFPVTLASPASSSDL